jgi:hypothetical protein
VESAQLRSLAVDFFPRLSFAFTFTWPWVSLDFHLTFTGLTRNFHQLHFGHGFTVTLSCFHPLECRECGRMSELLHMSASVGSVLYPWGAYTQAKHQMV